MTPPSFFFYRWRFHIFYCALFEIWREMRIPFALLLLFEVVGSKDTRIIGSTIRKSTRWKTLRTDAYVLFLIACFFASPIRIRRFSLYLRGRKDEQIADDQEDINLYLAKPTVQNEARHHRHPCCLCRRLRSL